MNWVFNKNTHDEIRVGWGVWSCATREIGKVEGEKVLHAYDQGGLEQCKVEALHSSKGLRLTKGISGWCVVC
jgi:hypothetical protein